MDLLLIGRVARAHGNKGQVIVNPETDFPEERFAPGNTLVVEHLGTSTPRRIASARFQQGRPIIALDGVESMNDAEALAGAELKMPASALGPLPGRTYYRHDLVGCEVRDTSGRVIGTVADVQGSLERSLLVVGGGTNEVMIPMVDGIVVAVDPGARRIVVELPEGLIGLNSATRTSDSE
jgi:16S rRNA processing protein RimM